MPMKKQDRKTGYADIMSLMLKGENKEAFTKLACMCGEDTGLFVMADYNKAMDKDKDRIGELEHALAQVLTLAERDSETFGGKRSDIAARTKETLFKSDLNKSTNVENNI